MDERSDVPLEIVAELRASALALPETREEMAWVGARWRIRGKTFAHVVRIDAGWPPAYARAAGSDGPSQRVDVLVSRPRVDVLVARAIRSSVRRGAGGRRDGARREPRLGRDRGAARPRAFASVAPKKLVDLVARPID